LGRLAPAQAHLTATFASAPMSGDTDNPDAPGDAKSEIRRLNDLLRTSGAGGRIVTTAGIDQLSIGEIALILSAVARFNDFNADNDPHGEHDCALVRAAGHDVIFKIDYFNTELRYHSPNPADPTVTRRVLTIMLAEEY
jgi:Protein of unknown function (DUF3768)